MARLARKLGMGGVFCLAAGAMISSGLFVLPGVAAREAGPAVVLAYALAGVLVLPALLSQTELATAMPRSGGTYFFIERSLGSWLGTLAGLANWFSIALKSAFALIGIGACATLIWPEMPAWQMKAIAVACCAAFTLVNLVSVKSVEWVQVAVVALLLGVLGVFLVGGFASADVHLQHFAGFSKTSSSTLLATAAMVFVSFGGLTKVAGVAEEVRRPGKNLPAGMFSATVVVTVIYVAAVFLAVGVLGVDRLAGSLTPLSATAREFLGPWGAALMGAAAMMAFVTTANAGLLSASRSPMAMARDGLLPAALGRVNRRFRTPHVSVLLTAAFMILVILALDIRGLVKAASTMMLILFLLVNVAVIVMRRSGLHNYRPLFRTPLVPWLPLAGIGIYGLLIFELIARTGAVPLVVTGAFALGATGWYFAYVRRRIVRESAFVHMVRRVVSKEIRRTRLDEELLHIALDRDDVSHDRFDRLVQSGAILDIQESITARDLFARAADMLAPKLGVDADELRRLFAERETDSSTVVQPGLAIPHVIVDGKDLFEVVLVRCKGGVAFGDEKRPVHIAFILVGSRDQRNFHLRALMAVSHIVGEPEFFRRWMTAPRGEHLRDIVLLSGRTREDS